MGLIYVLLILTYYQRVRVELGGLYFKKNKMIRFYLQYFYNTFD